MKIDQTFAKHHTTDIQVHKFTIYRVTYMGTYVQFLVKCLCEPIFQSYVLICYPCQSHILKYVAHVLVYELLCCVYALVVYLTVCACMDSYVTGTCLSLNLRYKNKTCVVF